MDNTNVPPELPTFGHEIMEKVFKRRNYGVGIVEDLNLYIKRNILGMEGSAPFEIQKLADKVKTLQYQNAQLRYRLNQATRKLEESKQHERT